MQGCLLQPSAAEKTEARGIEVIGTRTRQADSRSEVLDMIATELDWH